MSLLQASSGVCQLAPPFVARRFRDPEIERSDSSPQVRSARSVTFESSLAVHAAMTARQIGFYLRRERRARAEVDFPACGGATLAGTRRCGQATMTPKRLVGVDFAAPDRDGDFDDT
jgi:hypothetical protein